MQIRRSYFDEEQCFDIITQNINNLSPSRMGGWVYDPTYRNSSSVFLEDDKLEKNFKNITNNRHKNNKIAIQFTEYNVGQFYGWHEDHDRIQSFTLLLNDDFEGGDLEFKNEGNIKLGLGDVIAFDSKLEHRVTKITKGVRYSLVAWVLNKPGL